MRGGCGGPSYITKSVNWQNISPAMNASISCGMFVRLSKYFNYELSLAYYHYTLKYKATEGITNISSGDYSTMSYNWNYTSNALFISNGLSFTYKKFILTNSLMLGMNFPTHSSNYYFTYSPSLYLMSEHKIGYNIYKNRIEPYIGINVLDNFRTAAVIPFASVRINF